MMKNKENNPQEISLPQVLIDSCLRKQGLILLVGNRHSLTEKILESLKSKWDQTEENTAVFVTRNENSGLESHFQIVAYENMNEVKIRRKLNDSSVVVFDDVQFEDELSAATNLSESGRLVIVHVCTNSIISALHRIFGLSLQTQNSHLLWRIIDGLNLMFSQTRIINSKKESVFAHEVVLASSEVKKCLWARDLNDFEELMNESGENSGIVTMNQSLLQLIIRRRIEIKTAFEICRDPVDLDHLLKKVGV